MQDQEPPERKKKAPTCQANISGKVVFSLYILSANQQFCYIKFRRTLRMNNDKISLAYTATVMHSEVKIGNHGTVRALERFLEYNS